MRFEDLQKFHLSSGAYETLPFRYARLPNNPGEVLVTSAVGEYLFLSESDFGNLATCNLDRSTNLYRDLRNRQIVCDANVGLFCKDWRPSTRLESTLSTKTRPYISLLSPSGAIIAVTIAKSHPGTPQKAVSTWMTQPQRPRSTESLNPGRCAYD